MKQPSYLLTECTNFESMYLLRKWCKKLQIFCCCYPRPFQKAEEPLSHLTFIRYLLGFFGQVSTVYSPSWHHASRTDEPSRQPVELNFAQRGRDEAMLVCFCPQRGRHEQSSKIWSCAERGAIQLSVGTRAMSDALVRTTTIADTSDLLSDNSPT